MSQLFIAILYLELIVLLFMAILIFKHVQLLL